MISQSQREARRARARAMYAEGLCRAEIARLLGVREQVVRTWARRDLQRGVSWEAERQQEEMMRPERQLRLLERRFGRLLMELERADAQGASEDRPGLESRLQKMSQILNGYRKSAPLVSLQIGALEEFAQFCITHLPREHLVPVRDAVQKFLDHLRKDS